MQYKITAIAYDKRGKILSVGQNSYYKTHPLMSKVGKKLGEPDKIFIHAELDAILKARSNNIHRLAIFRFNNAGNPRNAKPCKICQEFIKMFKIKHVEYTVE